MSKRAVLVRMEEGVHQAVVEAAHGERVSVNWWVCRAVEHALYPQKAWAAGMMKAMVADTAPAQLHPPLTKNVPPYTDLVRYETKEPRSADGYPDGELAGQEVNRPMPTKLEGDTVVPDFQKGKEWRRLCKPCQVKFCREGQCRCTVCHV